MFGPQTQTSDMRESQENVSFKKSTMRTMADGECFTPDKYQFYHFIQLRLSFNAQLKSCVLCDASEIIQDRVNFCTLVCIPHLRLTYCLDHYFYVHLVFLSVQTINSWGTSFVSYTFMSFTMLVIQSHSRISSCWLVHRRVDYSWPMLVEKVLQPDFFFFKITKFIGK